MWYMGLIRLLFMKGGGFPKLLMFNECNVQAKQHESIIKQNEMLITQTQALLQIKFQFHSKVKFQNKNS